MASITSGIGLISGLNSGAIINALISLDSAPMKIVNSEITQAQTQQQAYTSLSTGISGIQSISRTLTLPQTFEAAAVNSSDPNVLTATAADGAAVGSYQFQVAQLVTTQQSVTNGFANVDKAAVGAGTITLEQGGGEATSQATLDQLNGGSGVQRGQFRITDRSGATAIIDTSSDVTLDQVVNQINTSNGISVKASLTNQGLVLTDTTGRSSNNLIVTDLNNSSAAASLGIAGDAGAGATSITGLNINTLGAATQLSSLNDGLGVRTAADATKADFSITASDGTAFNINLSKATTVADVLTTINHAAGGKVRASVAADGQSLTLSDAAGGGGTLAVTPLNSSSAAADLGLTSAAASGTIAGKPLIAGLDSVLVSSLNGGKGFDLGVISVRTRGGGASTIDLSQATSVSDIISTINNAGVGILASVNAAGTGIQVNDVTGGSGNLIIGDVTSTTAASLGIAGTFDTSTPVVNGNNLQRQYINQNTALSTLGGGTGVNLGKFKITNSSGNVAVVDLSAGSVNTVGDVIAAINAKNVGVTASINNNGNGILLTDTAGGANKLKVDEVGNTTAAGLNLLGAATGTTIDGGFQKTISVSATDTLTSVQSKINGLGFGITAQVVNDGASGHSFRLSLTSTNSGRAGRVIIDGGSTGLAPRALVKASDATVLLGGGDGTQPLLITSSKNALSNVIKGVTINLVGASTEKVTLNVTQDPTSVETDLTNFTTQFNSVMNSISTFTSFDTSTDQGGLLLGDQTAQQIQSVMFNALNTVVSGAGKFRLLSDLGITVGGNAQLTFDTAKFEAAFAADPRSVQNLFSQATTGLGQVLTNATTALVDPLNGVITTKETTLTNRITNYQTYLADLTKVVDNQRIALQTQFNNMETTLATLQGQQSSLGSLASSLSSIKSASSSSSSSK